MTTLAIKDNFDINVYNRGADMSTVLPADEYYDEWVLCPYSLVENGIYLDRLEELNGLNLVLTKEEAQELTLGWGPELGGDYIEDDDFWLDAVTFKDIYKQIPARVSEWLDLVMSIL